MQNTTSQAIWELIIDDRDHSVRRLAVPTGWLYQAQAGREYHTAYGTVGREHDVGTPTWGAMVFVPGETVKPVPSVQTDSQVLEGQVVDFDERTWWGRVCYDSTTIDFHATCYRGASKHHLPKPGQKVTIILNGLGNLLSVEGR